MGEQIALLVHGAALHRHVVPQAGERRFQAFAAVDDHQFGSAEPTAGQVVQHGPPRGLALATHVLDGEHHLLAVAADTEGNQQRNGRGLAIEPDLDHGAVEDQPHDVVAGEITLLPGLPGLPGRAGLLPGPADHVLANMALEQPGQRAPRPAGVHAGEVDLGDQGLGAMGEPLVSGQQVALPFLLASLVAQTSARHR